MNTCPKLVLTLVAILALAGASGRRVNAVVAAGTLEPGRLRVEYLVDPLAVDTREPRLSWEFKDGAERGARQSAYQVLVAGSLPQLAAGKGDVWNSGKVLTAQSVHVPYGGRALRSGERCYWAVRVWDGRNRASRWSAPAQFAIGLLDPDDWKARWIGDAAPSTDDVSATMLRRAFTLPAKPVRATAYVTALGMYELRVNGRRTSRHQLAPEWTDYRTRVQYQAYDVTPFLQAGDNVAAAILADGWYAGAIGLTEAMRRPPRNTYGAHPRLLAQIEIDFADGTHATVVSDDTWRTTREGPIRSADILNGETYDARREMRGWDSPGYADAAWHPADVAGDVKVRLVPQPNEAIAVTGEIRPIALTQPKPGVFVFDLGQNMVGWCRLALRGAAGTTVVLRHAEMLDDNGMIYTDNLRAARQTDRYILRGGAAETFEPAFTYHGFRYVEITGAPQPPRQGDLVGVVVHSDTPPAGTFESSNALLNQLWKNVRWTQRSNMHSIPTDCPQRDERLGWMGDILVFAQTAAFNFDMAAFFKKWTVDVRDAQAADGRFPDFAPHPFEPDKRFSGAPGWGDAGVVVPWRAYENYGDARILEGQYEAAKRWVEFIRRENPNLLWKNKRGNDYGDWLNADTLVKDGWPKTGGEVPKEVFATTMFAHSADLVARMARVLGRQDDAAQYRALFEDIKIAFNRAYVKPDGTILGDTQAGYALALYFDLLPAALRERAVAHMVAGLDRYNGHMSTGFHSTYRMMLELTSAGRTDLAYKLALERTFPSWGYSIDNGATTIWERWDGYVKGRGFQDKGMNSFNHYAIGAVGEWLYRVVLGINPDPEHPAYEHVIVRPMPGGGLTSARGSYHSIRGPIEVAWRQNASATAVDVAVPPNVTATVWVPASKAAAVLEGGVPAQRAAGVKFVRAENGAAVFEVGSGRYHFTAR